MSQGRNPYQHLHVGQRLLPRRLREESDRDLPREGLLHDHRESRPVHSDGLPEKESRNDPLKYCRKNKKAPRLAGLCCKWATTSFSSSPSSLLELFSSLPFLIHLRSLLSLPLLLTFFGYALCLKIFVRHVTQKFKAKIKVGRFFIQR